MQEKLVFEYDRVGLIYLLSNVNEEAIVFWWDLTFMSKMPNDWPLYFIFLVCRRIQLQRLRIWRSLEWMKSLSMCCCAMKMPTSIRTSLAHWSNWRQIMTRSLKSPRCKKKAYLFTLVILFARGFKSVFMKGELSSVLVRKYLFNDLNFFNCFLYFFFFHVYLFRPKTILLSGGTWAWIKRGLLISPFPRRIQVVIFTFIIFCVYQWFISIPSPTPCPMHPSSMYARTHAPLCVSLWLYVWVFCTCLCITVWWVYNKPNWNEAA